MRLCRKLLLFIVFFVLTVQNSYAIQQPVMFKNGQAVFKLKDRLKHPFYWWPNTLLSYQVRFEGPVKQEDFRLKETIKGELVDFQFSDQVNLKDGGVLIKLNFISDLPSGSEKNFVLERGRQASSVASIVALQDGNSILIKTDKLALRIPNSQGSSLQIPGPLSQLYPAGKSKMGNSILYPGNKVLSKIETEMVASGPVFLTYRITYLFTDGARYIAHIKCVKGYDFVEIREEMTGMIKGDKLFWKMDWRNFNPTHRQAPNHPFGGAGDKPGFARFEWEKIDQKMLNSHHGVMPDPTEEGKLPFDIGLYQPWPAEKVVTSAVFWDEKSDQSIGVFINDAAYWDDKDYPIWQSSKLLDINFFYRNNELSWEYPIAQGTRSIGVSCYPHKKDIEYMDELEVKSKRQIHVSGNSYHANMAQLSYNTHLQNRYGTINLNKVKDWQLYYPDTAALPPIVFKSGKYKSLRDLESFFYGSYTAELTFSGTRQNSGYSPVPARSFYEDYLDGYNRLFPGLKPEDKERFSAMFLIHAYISADEEFMPMRHMLSGHPNFLADVKTIPAMAAFLFPAHPEAKNWTDLFEKYIDLNTKYHTRPSVKTWNAKGGRWTENLSAYTWAFLRPTLQTNTLLQKYFDKKNRVAGENTEQIGAWILNSLSAPYAGESLEFYRTPKGALDKHSWGVVTGDKGPKRVHSPLGAHSLRRQPPSFFWALGEALKNYAPILSENIRYLSHPDDENMKARDQEPSVFQDMMFPKKGFDKGTKPDLKSIKLTGYGNILRADVNTADELSIHLMQIDQGPNYRWGRAADGGTGTIYFYAGGKSYSHNGKEDIGDRRLEDTDQMTNFGVFKDGTFKSIGQNILSRPLYDLGIGQFTEIIPSKEKRYSWPEYQGRSVMLVGADYFITYDDVYNRNIGGRFSWFTHLNEELPNLQVIKAGGTEDRNRVLKTEITGPETKGVYFDGTDDFMFFVSHKKGFEVSSAKYGAIITNSAKQTDYIFRSDKPILLEEAGLSFIGKAGFIRKYNNLKQDLVLFQGNKIGNGNFFISTNQTEAGISATIANENFISGRFFSADTARVTFTWANGAPDRITLYIDGKKNENQVRGNSITVLFPSGAHSWQLTNGFPVPVRPKIIQSENDHGKVKLFFTHAAGSKKTRLEISNDQCETWKVLAETDKINYTVSGAIKAHVRVIATNKEHHSEASEAYPLYFTNQKPSHPDGLRAVLEGERVRLSWGQVLGSYTYKLYRRQKGDSQFKLVYIGRNNVFEDKLKVDKTIYEYAISAINKNGESKLSNAINTDPNSWLNLNPKPYEKFRRANTTIGTDQKSLYYPN